MGLLSTAVMVKREDGSEKFPVVPPGFSASDSTPATVKRKVSGDDKSAVDDVDHLPLKQRMRMLDVGGVSCSSLGIESRRKIPTYCVDEAFIEEARPLKVAAGGALPVADRAYIRSESGARLVGTGASMSHPSCRRMPPLRLIEPSHQSDEAARAPDQANSSTASSSKTHQRRVRGSTSSFTCTKSVPRRDRGWACDLSALHSSSSDSLILCSLSHATPLTARPPPLVDLGRFAGRTVNFECQVSNSMFADNDTLDWLTRIGWNPILKAEGKANAKRARMFFSLIRNPRTDPLGFDLDFNGFITHIDVDFVSQALGVPRGTVFIDEKNIKRQGSRDERTKFLCGRLTSWRSDGSLPATSMLPPFRVLHHIFVQNVYPRVGNRSDLTPFMVELLYQVGHGQKVCLPTIVLLNIVKAAANTRKVGLPYGRLICKLARRHGVDSPATEPEPITVIDKGLVDRLRIGGKHREKIDTEEVGEEEQEEGEENEDEDEEYVASQSLDEQLARMNEQLTRLEKRISKTYSIVKKILCCVQKEGETPPPYSADE